MNQGERRTEVGGGKRKTVSQIKKEIDALLPEQIEEGIAPFLEDERAGVQKIVEQARRRRKAYEMELLRTQELWRDRKSVV